MLRQPSGWGETQYYTIKPISQIFTTTIWSPRRSSTSMLPVGDRYLCNQDINGILKSRPSTRRRWLIRARRARARQLNDKQHQTEITDFFSIRGPSTTNNTQPPEQDCDTTPSTQHQPDTNQTITRQRYHDRPPDPAHLPTTATQESISYRATRQPRL